MAELRRRKGDGDTADATNAGADGDVSAAAAATVAPTLVAEAVDELLREKTAGGAAAAAAAALDPLQLSDSATADSSDHVSMWVGFPGRVGEVLRRRLRSGVGGVFACLPYGYAFCVLKCDPRRVAQNTIITFKATTQCY